MVLKNDQSPNDYNEEHLVLSSRLENINFFWGGGMIDAKLSSPEYFNYYINIILYITLLMYIYIIFKLVIYIKYYFIFNSILNLLLYIKKFSNFSFLTYKKL